MLLVWITFWSKLVAWEHLGCLTESNSCFRCLVSSCLKWFFGPKMLFPKKLNQVAFWNGCLHFHLQKTKMPNCSPKQHQLSFPTKMLNHLCQLILHNKYFKYYVNFFSNKNWIIISKDFVQVNNFMDSGCCVNFTS